MGKFINNKFVQITVFSAGVILFTALPAICSPAVPLKQTAMKFILAMGGVALSSLIIFTGLSVYNKFFADKKDKDEDDSLTTPDSINDAIVFFIRKNKLK